MTKATKPIPEGYHTITPHLVIKGADKAIDFYKRALGAEELFRMNSPDGRVSHAELKIGDSIVFLADEFPEMGGTCRSPQSLGGTAITLNLYVPDVDTRFRRALDAGGKELMPLGDMFWGDRYGMFTDPFGHTWAMATHKEDLSPQEIEERAKQFYAQMAQSQRKSA